MRFVEDLAAYRQQIGETLAAEQLFAFQSEKACECPVHPDDAAVRGR
jgi:hypothetical protein